MKKVHRTYWFEFSSKASKTRFHHLHTYLHKSPCNLVIFRISTQLECNTKHFRFIWGCQVKFRILVSVVLFRTHYHGLPSVMIQVTMFVTVWLWKFSTIFNSYYFLHITRGVTLYSAIYFLINKTIFVSLSTRYQVLLTYFERVSEGFLDGKLLENVENGQMCTYFTIKM